MKKYLSPIILSSFILFSCDNSSSESIPEIDTQEQTNDTISQLTEPANEGLDFVIPETPTDTILKKDYQEFYPTGELKIHGDYDENEARQGLWISYYENGKKWSESNYSHGVKAGHSITFFPNGRVRYVGEYANDKQVGNWTFYDEDGKVVKEENY